MIKEFVFPINVVLNIYLTGVSCHEGQVSPACD